MPRKRPAPLPSLRVEIRLAGSGGQGIILAGLVLAEAAGVHDGREVAMSQSYGPEARGGASKAEVILSDQPIDYPLCAEVDLLLALTQEAADTYCGDLAPNAQVIVDRDLVRHPPVRNAVALPFTATAREKINREMTANVIALGALSELTGFVSRRSLERTLTDRVPAGFADMNKRALGLGVRMVKELDAAVRRIAAEEISDEDM